MAERGSPPVVVADPPSSQRGSGLVANEARDLGRGPEVWQQGTATDGTPDVFTTDVEADLPLFLAQDFDAAFPCLVQRYTDLVYSVALRLVRDPAEAEEVAQDTFLRAHRALESYGPERRLEMRIRPWLARIALNLARNRLRRGPRGEVPLDELMEFRGPARDEPARVLERRESARHWAGLLATLPAAQRQAVELRHVEGLSYAEVAEVLDRPIGTVKAHVHRGVRLLRDRYEQDAGSLSLEGTHP
jgi:RNA polymerase sigma factor (sigma-70 family)